MPQIAPAESSADSFSGLLASLAAPQGSSAAPWDDGLADDIATISYEPALRTSASRPAPPTEPAAAQAPSGEVPFPPTRNRLKTASITIRLSEAECRQLRQRAAEAGLSVSAYLRSCTLEVETLRAQVKETLAQLRQSSPTRPEAIAPTQVLRPSAAPGIWHRLWPLGSFRRR
jgi:hypothetical protein